MKKGTRVRINNGLFHEHNHPGFITKILRGGGVGGANLYEIKMLDSGSIYKIHKGSFIVDKIKPRYFK